MLYMKKGVLCKMPLILLKTEKNVIYEILGRKIYYNMKKLFSTK